MAPEQFSDFRKAGLTADIYSLGKMLYEAVSGTLDPKQLPFKAMSLDDPQTPFCRAIDPIIRKATHEDKGRRYQSMAELRKALAAILQEVTDAIGESRPQPTPPKWARYTWAGVILAILSVLGMTLYHLAGKSLDAPVTIASSPGPQTTTALREQPTAENTAATTLLAPNGRTLHRVGDSASGSSFYADPKLITYHHYVEFLNEVADRVAVADGIVKNGDTIWIYIGDGDAEPILYISGRFQLRTAQRAPDPVVRVTWKGAQAYAAYYGMQLPTYGQWQTLHREPGFAAQGETPPDNSTPESVHDHMMGSSGTMNAVSDRSQTSGGGTPPIHKEWVTTSSESTREGVADWERVSPPPDPVHRHPWEAFDDVGFRTVRDAR
jgi:serine/threonine-protein kinase